MDYNNRNNININIGIITGSITIIEVLLRMFSKFSLFKSNISTGITLSVVGGIIIVFQKNFYKKKYNDLEVDNKVNIENAERLRGEILKDFEELKNKSEKATNISYQKTDMIRVTGSFIEELTTVFNYYDEGNIDSIFNNLEESFTTLLGNILNIPIKNESNLINATIFVMNKDQLVRYKTTKKSSNSRKKTKLPISKSFAGECYTTKKMMVVNSFSQSQGCKLYDLPEHKTIKSIACFPILDLDEIFGVLCVTSERENIFTDEYVSFLKISTYSIALLFRLMNLKSCLCENVIKNNNGEDVSNELCKFKFT